MHVDAEYHRQLRSGEVSIGTDIGVFKDSDYGGYMNASSEARYCASRYSAPWRARYPTESPLWVVRIPDGYAVVPNSLYYQNKPWEDLCADYIAKK